MTALHWRDLTQRQRVALRNPCLLAQETAHQMFDGQSMLGTVRLTVNSGYE